MSLVLAVLIIWFFLSLPYRQIRRSYRAARLQSLRRR